MRKMRWNNGLVDFGHNHMIFRHGTEQDVSPWLSIWVNPHEYMTPGIMHGFWMRDNFGVHIGRRRLVLEFVSEKMSMITKEVWLK